MARLEGEPCMEVEDNEGEAAEGGQDTVEEQAAEVMDVPPPIQPIRTSCSRPRGRRQRGAPPHAFVVDVVTFNGSGAPQLLEAMGALAGDRASLAALLVQEHHGMGDSLADLQAGARARGLKLAPSEATAGKGGGMSAGVGVAAPTHRGWGGISAAQWDFSPAESPGRLAGAWLQAGPRGGMVVLSIYCWASEGMSPRNVALVSKALGGGGGLWQCLGHRRGLQRRAKRACRHCRWDAGPSWSGDQGSDAANVLSRGGKGPHAGLFPRGFEDCGSGLAGRSGRESAGEPT